MKTFKKFIFIENVIKNTIYTILISDDEKKHFDASVKLNTQIKNNFPEYEMALVGGASRDLFSRLFFKRKVRINDLDFVIYKRQGIGLNAKELTELTEFIKNLGYIVIDEIKFLHLKIITPEKYEIEYTSARKEAYREMSRKPETIVGDLETDIKRRDFTINAIYLNIVNINGNSITVKPANEQTLSFIEHVKNNVLQTTDTPENVFEDDPLRTLRAVRFSGYGYKMTPELEKSVKEYPKEKIYKKVSLERIADELGKILSKGDVNFLLKSGFITKFIDEFAQFEDKEYKDYELQHIIDVIKIAREKAPKDKQLIFLLAALFHDVGKGMLKPGTNEPVGTYNLKKGRWAFPGHENVSATVVKKVLKKLRFSNKIIEDVSNLVSQHMETKFFIDKPLKTIIMWILKYDNQQKYPDLIDNVILFNEIDWGGKSQEWKENNKDLIKHQEIAKKILNLRDEIREIKKQYKKDLQEISEKVGNDKNIPNESKAKAILKMQANFIINKIKNKK